MNINSIAGHITCSQNSDYSASKFALKGFTDALRQGKLQVMINKIEMAEEFPQVAMTNIYPYYINTGMF